MELNQMTMENFVQFVQAHQQQHQYEQGQNVENIVNNLPGEPLIGGEPSRNNDNNENGLEVNVNGVSPTEQHKGHHVDSMTDNLIMADTKVLLDRGETSHLVEKCKISTHQGDVGKVRQSQYIQDYEEEPPSQERQAKYLNDIVCAEKQKITEFIASYPFPVALSKRVHLVSAILEALSKKFHCIKYAPLDKPRKSGQGQESKAGAFEQSWQQSSDAANHGLCNDILNTASDVVLSLPPLSLANEAKLPKLARESLDQVMRFLSEIIKGRSISDEEGKNLCADFLLGLSLQRGSLLSILEWIEVAFLSAISGKCIFLPVENLNYWLLQIKSSRNDRENLSKDTEVIDSETQSQLPIHQASLFMLKEVTQLAVEYVQSLSLFDDVKNSTKNQDSLQANQAFVWGSNSSHQLGEEFQEKVMSCKQSNAFSQAAQVEAGQYCTFVIDNSGALFACGKGSYGRLGMGDSTNQSKLKITLMPSNKTVCQVASSKGSDGHTLALTTDGQVFSWGDGDYGKLGHGNTLMQKTPKRIRFVIQISAGNRHSGAVTDEGELYTWGEGDYGRLGHGDSSSKSIPTLVKNIAPVCQVVCASSHTLALSMDGLEVWSFGAGDNGKLGHGDNNRIFNPKVIETLQGIHMRKVISGCQSSLALTSGGQ
eukprot:gene6664-7416_t